MAGATERRIDFVRTLGRGGFGAVYLADLHGAKDFVQRVAVKVLSAEMNAHDDVAARQRDEARLLAQLNHDAIVKVFELTEVHGRPAVIMEYVAGVDAAVLLKSGPVPPRAAAQIVSRAASALEAAWDSPSPRTGAPLRVVHRDIKPANLLISRHGGVKVLDFGVARADFDREGLTGSVQFGTARFMAPEQWLTGAVGHGVDVYALGVSWVEMLTGSNLARPPLMPERFDAHIAAALDAAVDPSWAGADGLRALLLSMLRFDPADRPSAAQVHDAAADIAEQLSGDGLSRVARQRVPALLAARETSFVDDPLLSAMRLTQVPLGMSAARDTGPTAPAIDATHRVPEESVSAPTMALPSREGPPGWLMPMAGAFGVLVLALLSLGGWAIWSGAGGQSVDVRVDAVEAVAPEAVAPEAVAPEPTGGGPVADAPIEARVETDPVAESAAERPVDSAAADAPGSQEPSAAAPDRRPSRPPQRGSASPPASADPAEPAVGGPAVATAPTSTSPTAGTATATQLPPEPATPPPPAATVPVTITSVPFGASVTIDGQAVGATPVAARPLSVGQHRVLIVSGDARVERTITVARSRSNRYKWTVSTGAWESLQ